MAARSKRDAASRTGSGECTFEVAARLYEVERRLAALEAASVEAVADLAWQAATATPADRAQGADHRLTRLLAVLAAHRQATAAVMVMATQQETDPDIRRLATECFDQLWDRLRGAAAAMAELPASSAAHVRAKAEAIEVLCEECSEDIVHRLAASLARDVLTNVRPVS